MRGHSGSLVGAVMIRTFGFFAALVIALSLTGCGSGSVNTVPATSNPQRALSPSQVCGETPLSSRAVTDRTRFPHAVGACCSGPVTDTCYLDGGGGAGSGPVRGGGKYCDPGIDPNCSSGVSLCIGACSTCDPTVNPTCVNPIVIARSSFNTTAESACTTQHGRFVSADDGEFWCRHTGSFDNPTVTNPAGCGYLISLPPDIAGTISVIIDFTGYPSLASSGTTARQGVRVYGQYGPEGCIWTGAGPNPAT